MQDVDAGDGVERDGNVEVEVTGFGVVDAEAVDEDEGLLECGAADGEVGLDAFAGAGLQRRGMGRCAGGRRRSRCRWADRRDDDFDGAVAFGER